MKMDSSKKPSCYNCAYCGADMDMDAFCTHPKLGEKWPYGKVLHAGIEHCLKDRHQVFRGNFRLEIPCPIMSISGTEKRLVTTRYH